ncbi:hypothetical protein BW247_10910 [Acidihalobacter ferrooxydans]|uniref:FHA domain-containing protein n=1 Tax=Acidihalobacter ferrooxydans TaxID=1765967 RepID=A0A1P8UI61_9GAMM|nr:hypothetical protein BW247_10910 [Acidihalobacter ferrooxydans]
MRRELRAKELRLRFQGRDFIMRETSILLGRQSECAIVVADPLVSREHVRIERRGDQYVLADTSRNGTYVQFHGSQQVHHVKQGELVLSSPGMLLMGRVFAGQGYEQNIVYFDMA